MKKVIKIIVFGLIGVLLVLKLLQSIGFINNINVEAIDPLTTMNVEVKYGNVSFSDTDKIIYENLSKGKLVFNGIYSTWIPYNYGENDFLITYDDKYYGFFRHFKHNIFETHSYSLELFQNNDTIKCKVLIEGPDKMERIIKMKKITMLQQRL
tara:strand:+ start:62 stop:520 length:459 start_codon:yes stop_codon:yes gene_type:complete